MLERSIPALLKLFPRGLTDDQLLWRLKQGGFRTDPSSILAALDNLGSNGQVRRERDRWIAVAPASTVQPAVAGSAQASAAKGATSSLSAVLASILDRPEPADAITSEDQDDPEVTWNAALSYFAATQRRDPRGTTVGFPDQHGSIWQLFHGSGRWWERAEIRIETHALPGALRETLSRIGQDGTGSIGWPMAAFRGQDGATCLPALLFPVSWRLTAEAVLFWPDPVPPNLNPAWVQEIRRRTAWTEDTLHETLFQGEDSPPFGDLADRLGHALARLVGGRLQPAELGSELRLDIEAISNAAGFFLPGEGTFTRAVAGNLDQIAEWTPDVRRGTSLGHLFEGTGAAFSEPLVAEPSPLTDAQFVAAHAALSGPLTLIQGPPGTGKSQTIVSLLCAALAQGQSVLFVARNHRAIDEVERRLAELLPDSPVLTRGRDAEGDRNQGFVEALVALAESAPGDPDAVLSGRAASEVLAAELRAATMTRRAAQERDRLGLALAELAERAEALRVLSGQDTASPARTTWRAQLQRLLSTLMRRSNSHDSQLPDRATLAEVEERIRQIQKKFDGIRETGPVSVASVIPPLKTMAKARTTPDSDTIARLRAMKAELEFQRGGLKLRSLDPVTARLILRHRPIWAVTSLSVPARIPLIPGLFDLAIFDEASQCDIASALPVLARARRAVVVGDPQQLSFIPGVGRAQEHALMDAAGIPRVGRSRWAQSINSLYDFFAHRLPIDRVHLLRDQFRSAPHIVDYTNAAFYGQRLVARRNDDDFQPPAGYRPGLHWQDVTGPTARDDGGNINRSEAEWIISRLRQFAMEDSFGGSVGIISPFNAQVALLRRLTAEALTSAEQQRLRLHVDTVDRWQGGEADVILFSIVAGRGAPQSAVTFLSRERRRFNVAISRARAVAVVVGDLAWARSCGIAHISMLADRCTRQAPLPLELSESLWERRMAVALQGRGLTFQQQYPVGRRRLDFALFRGQTKLNLEVDGRRWHSGPDGNRKTADRLRDREMIALGWKVRRFWVHELQTDMERCLDLVERDLE